jgi:hypothetical protein
MRPYKLSFLFLLGLWLSACTKDREIGPGFDLVYQQDFAIPAGIGAFAVHHFYLKNIPTRLEEILTQNGKTLEDIESVLTDQATLTGVFGDADYDFIDQVSVRAYYEGDPKDFIEIAYRQPVPLDPGNNLPLIPSLANSKRFFTGSPRFSLDVTLWLRKTTQDEFPTRLNLKMRAVTK